MSASSSSRVSVDVEAGIADVRLSRPEKLNALDPSMFEALADTAARLETDPGIRAVVLSGEGRGFCAGIDLSTLFGSDPGGPLSDIVARYGGRAGNVFQQAALGWADVPVPVIAAVHGVALGGGAQVALGADIRIFAPDAKFAVAEIRWGIVPDMSGTLTLPRLVGPDVALELSLTGRTISGEEALRLGIATKVADDPRAAALELAAEIASKNPHAVRAAKRLLRQSGRVAVDRQLLDESIEMASLLGSPNQIETVKAHFDGRAPVYADPDLGL